MTSARRRVLGLVLGLAGQAGCAGTPETRYYTLSAVPVGVTDSTRTSPLSVMVATVGLPGVLDRPQMVEQTGANTVRVREFDRWAEPLDQMLRRVLREDVARRSTSRRNGMARVAIAIDEFMGQADGTARLAGQWWWVSDAESSHPASRHSFQFSIETGSGDMSGMAAALSRLLGRLAADIAGSDRA